MNVVKQVVDYVGGQTVAAKICGVSAVAVHKWVKRGCLPRTDFTGKTKYARKLAEASCGTFSETQLLSEGNPDRAGS